MADKPNTYIRLYFSNLSQLERLSFEQVGRLTVGIMKYKACGEPFNFDDDTVLSVVAEGILGRVEEDFSSYERICAKNRVNGSKGGAPKGNKNAQKSTETTDHLKTTQLNKQITKQEKKIYNLASKTTYTSEIQEIVDYLNQKACTTYRATTKNTVKHITARLKEGYTVADVKAVIDSKAQEWLGTGYQKYLRPDTLFGAKFESYLNSADNSGDQQGGIAQFL